METKNAVNFQIKCVVLVIFILLFFVGYTNAGEHFSKGESVYVSIYSNVYSGVKLHVLELSGMLSIRNTDPKYSISILKANYYDSKGELLEPYVTKPLKLKPLESTHFLVKVSDKRGGPGAKFIVKWQSDHKVNQPIIEGVMLSTRAQQGISFICPGKIISEHSD
ncbi:MAG: DUF3124 domain-containing protein [Desulfobacterales bacterium]|nr:DUF3124 domain-containing protein [Desulfobacterales bacterium]